MPAHEHPANAEGPATSPADHAGADKVLEDTGLGNHPKIIKLFYDMSQRLSEDGLIPGEVQGVYAPEAALAKIAELRQNPAYSNAGHPEHDRVVAEIEKYYQIAYSGR